LADHRLLLVVDMDMNKNMIYGVTIYFLTLISIVFNFTISAILGLFATGYFAYKIFRAIKPEQSEFNQLKEANERVLEALCRKP